MKKALLLVLASVTLMTNTPAFAWVEKNPTQKNYTFKFKLKTSSFEYSRTAPSYEEAFESAAQACFTHFKGGRRIAENEGLDIIDVCANPRG